MVTISPIYWTKLPRIIFFFLGKSPNERGNVRFKTRSKIRTGFNLWHPAERGLISLCLKIEISAGVGTVHSVTHQYKQFARPQIFSSALETLVLIAVTISRINQASHCALCGSADSHVNTNVHECFSDARIKKFCDAIANTQIRVYVTENSRLLFDSLVGFVFCMSKFIRVLSRWYFGAFVSIGEGNLIKKTRQWLSRSLFLITRSLTSFGFFVRVRLWSFLSWIDQEKIFILQRIYVLGIS